MNTTIICIGHKSQRQLIALENGLPLLPSNHSKSEWSTAAIDYKKIVFSDQNLFAHHSDQLQMLYYLFHHYDLKQQKFLILGEMSDHNTIAFTKTLIQFFEMAHCNYESILSLPLQYLYFSSLRQKLLGIKNNNRFKNSILDFKELMIPYKFLSFTKALEQVEQEILRIINKKIASIAC